MNITRADHSPAWQVIHEKRNRDGLTYDLTERMAVPGGWLYRTVLTDASVHEGIADIVSMVFVPEPREGA